MWLLQGFLDRSKQLNQTPNFVKYPEYHPPNNKYKIVHQGLILPNLPAPLHYVNFLSIIGQPNIPTLLNPNSRQTASLDTATVICSTSPHMVGQFKRYSIQKDCHFRPDLFEFSNCEVLEGYFPEFQLLRNDTELTLHLNIQTLPLVSYFTQIRFSLAEHWSVLCKCEGDVIYKGKNYSIAGLGSFEYARSVSFPYLPLNFFCYQVINISQNRQLLMEHIRDRFNQIIKSRIYVRDLRHMQTRMYDENVCFRVHRIYPLIVTPNGQRMYLPREFEWSYQNEQGDSIMVKGRSRGDFKFGLAAGYVGSFRYEIKIDQECEQGESGYCEYIDCRPLIFQEQDKEEKLLDYLANPVPIFAKTH